MDESATLRAGALLLEVRRGFKMWALIIVIVIIAAFAVPGFREILLSAKGWKRVWIFISGIYLLLVIFVAASLSPSQNIIKYIIEAFL